MKDVRYKFYVEHYKHFWPLDRLTPVIRQLIVNLNFFNFFSMKF
jgi:hypothetical protein